MLHVHVDATCSMCMVHAVPRPPPTSLCCRYQRWQYGIDTKRPNEYGQVEIDEDAPAQLATTEGAEGAAAADTAQLPPTAAPAVEANATQ